MVRAFIANPLTSPDSNPEALSQGGRSGSVITVRWAARAYPEQMKNKFFKTLVFQSRAGIVLGEEGKSCAEAQKELLLKKNPERVQKVILLNPYTCLPSQPK